MWSCVLSFCHSPCPDSRLVDGLVVSVDVLISSMLVVVDEGKPVVLRVDSNEECFRCCSEILRSDAIRLQCRFSPCTRHVERMLLSVDAPRFDALMDSASLGCEADITSLLTMMWHDVRVPSPQWDRREDDTYEFHEDHLSRWNSELPLFAHQESTLHWMKSRELGSEEWFPDNVCITRRWFVDVSFQRWTQCPEWKKVTLSGNICTDGTGTGKTATTLRHLMCSQNPRPNLVILPLNLVAQWKREFAKFLIAGCGKVLWLIQGKDLRSVTMASLEECDVVFTTFSFLRSSKTYGEVVDGALGSVHRHKAEIHAWSRKRKAEDAPVLEAVHWGRAVVDEFHGTMGSGRDLQHLRLLTYDVLWGLTATPDLEGHAELLVSLMTRRSEKLHPNLAASMFSTAVRGSREGLSAPAPALQLISLPPNELEQLQSQMARLGSIEEAVKACTHVEASHMDVVGEASEIERRLMASEKGKLAALQAQVDGKARIVRILDRSLRELEGELQDLAGSCAAGDPLATSQAAAAKEALAQQSLDLETVRRQWQSDARKLTQKQSVSRLLTEKLHGLKRREETCSICMSRECTVITPCAHVFCAPCSRRHITEVSRSCPSCRAPLQMEDLSGVVAGGGVGEKMERIGTLIRSLDDPVAILFVQWKSMLKGLKAYLRGIDVDVFTLDGNTSQRTNRLQTFSERGGVLLLCLEDSFEGLHLPHARHVLFAHALVGDREKVARMEQQAIARCARHGQTGTVQVYSFVVAECEEENLWHQTH